MTTKSERGDPWSGIPTPDRAAAISARRVDPSVRWGIFWGIDADRNCLVLIRHARVVGRPLRLPKLRGLRIEIEHSSESAHDSLVVRLVHREQREIFHRLCLDIVEAAGRAETEERAVERFLTRTWRWHRLLAGAPDGRLSDREQQGLIGELRTLDARLMPELRPTVAVQCWSGPFGAPRDFEIGRIYVEAKARRGGATPHVLVTSAHQLDAAASDRVFLSVVEVTRAVDDDIGAATLSEYAGRIRATVAERELDAVELFDERLAAAGLDWNDDYSDRRWLLGDERLFEVRDDFPHIAASRLPSGVDNVRYSISLVECERFRVGASDLAAAIRGATHDWNR